MCNKQKYDKLTALCALKEAKKQGKSHKWRKETRIYECPECGKWHLTSQEEYEEREEIPLDNLKYQEKWKQLM